MEISNILLDKESSKSGMYSRLEITGLYDRAGLRDLIEEAYVNTYGRGGKFRRQFGWVLGVEEDSKHVYHFRIIEFPAQEGLEHHIDDASNVVPLARVRNKGNIPQEDLTFEVVGLLSNKFGFYVKILRSMGAFIKERHPESSYNDLI